MKSRPKNFNVLSLNPAMLEDLKTVRVKYSGRVEGSSFWRIPSIWKFDVTPGDHNEILIGSGMERKLESQKKWKLNKTQNRYNKYMSKEVKYLRSLLANNRPDLFWKNVERNMKFSESFRTTSINSVLNQWYKSEDIQRVINVTYGVQKIISQEINELKYFRVEIPKGDPKEILKFFAENPGQAWPGKKRPLGVPTAPWRVVLHMWNGFLTIFLEEELKKFNHAYMPNRGTKTALAELIRKVRDQKYMYEFDIKGFFNNVSIVKTINSLELRGMKGKMLKKLEQILESTPNNIDIDDPDSMTSEYDKDLALRKANKKRPMREMTEHIPSLAWKQFLNDTIDEQNEDLESDQWERLDKGLPQGAAPSTILSLLALADWWKELKSKGISLMMYADDGILYSDKPFEPFPPEGFEFAEDKCSWVRSNMRWMKPNFKFLGVEYDTTRNLFRGSTRNGSTLEFGGEQIQILWFLKKIIPSD